MSGVCPANCWNKFLTLTYVSNTLVNTVSWQHHMNISALPSPYFLQPLWSGDICSAQAGSLSKSFSSSLPYERDSISQGCLEPTCTLASCLIDWNRQITTAHNNTLHVDVVIPKPEAGRAVRRGSSRERRWVLHLSRLNLWALTGAWGQRETKRNKLLLRSVSSCSCTENCSSALRQQRDTTAYGFKARA